MQRDCPNNKVMLLLETGEYDSTSEDEEERFADLEKSEDVHDADKDDDRTPLICEPGTGPCLICTQRVLSVHPRQMHEQRCNLFQTRADVGNEGKTCRLIIDGGSCHNLASKELCTKLGLRCKKHPHPYQI